MVVGEPFLIFVSKFWETVEIMLCKLILTERPKDLTFDAHVHAGGELGVTSNSHSHPGPCWRP